MVTYSGRSPGRSRGWLGPTEAEMCRGRTRWGFCWSDSDTSSSVTVVYAPRTCQTGYSVLYTLLPLILSTMLLHSGYYQTHLIYKNTSSGSRSSLSKVGSRRWPSWQAALTLKLLLCLRIRWGELCPRALAGAGLRAHVQAQEAGPQVAAFSHCPRACQALWWQLPTPPLPVL